MNSEEDLTILKKPFNSTFKDINSIAIFIIKLNRD